MRAKNPMRRSWLDETGGGWIPHRLRLIMSPAWVQRPIPVARILDRLEIEHMQHAGKENGELCVSFDQFVAAGVSRKIVRAAEEAAEALGLLVVVRSEEITRNIRQPNKYRLTYVPEKNRRAPTDEWQDITAEKAQAVVEAFQKIASGKRGPSYPRGTSPVPLSPKNTPSSRSPFALTPVTLGELSSISTTSHRTMGETGGAARNPKRRSKPPVARTEPSAPSLTAYRIGEQPPDGMIALGPSIDRASLPSGDAPRLIGEITESLLNSKILKGAA